MDEKKPNRCSTLISQQKWTKKESILKDIDEFYKSALKFKKLNIYNKKFKENLISAIFTKDS